MSIRIIEGTYDGDTTGAVMICSTSMWAFGPVFDDVQEVDCFQKWYADRYPESIRQTSQELLANRFGLFRAMVSKCAECDEWTVDFPGVCDECRSGSLES